MNGCVFIIVLLVLCGIVGANQVLLVHIFSVVQSKDLDFQRHISNIIQWLTDLLSYVDTCPDMFYFYFQWVEVKGDCSLGCYL